MPSFSELGLHPDLVAVCEERGWKLTTEIQRQAIPVALEGRDVIGLAVTGSGKTAAFTLPILNYMITNKAYPYMGIIITPTRELATQISEQLFLLGSKFVIKIVTLTGGMSPTDQIKALAKQPHVVVATPGRLVEHIFNTRGFDLSQLKFIVLDEADRLLTLDFEEELKQIIQACPTERQTFLFSATMTSRVSKLEKLSLRNPVKISVDEKTETAPNLRQFMCLVPPAEKFAWLAAMLKMVEAYRVIIFINTCKVAHVLNVFLKRLGFQSVCLSGDMNQVKRLEALGKFKNQLKNVLVATEVGSRGLDLPEVAYVINFDVPQNYRAYIHRVGRTARAGKHGQAFTLVNQYDAAALAKIELKMGRKLEVFDKIGPSDYSGLNNWREAQSAAEREYRELKFSGRKKK